MRPPWQAFVSLASLAALATCLACLLASPRVAAAPGAADDLVAAAASTDDRAAAEALFHLGELDEAALDFPSALARYDASVARLPSSPFAPRASRRARDLRSHAEGAFAPLVRLETVRRSPALSNDPAAIDALVRDAAAFPPGRVRVDARMLAAEAYLGRLRRPADALPLFDLVASDPYADVITAKDAAEQLLAGYTDARDYRAALDVADRHAKLLPRNTRKDLVRLLRRTPLRYASWADLALLLALALASLAGRERRRVLPAVRRLAPMALVFVCVACGVAGFLASRYERSNPYPFTTVLPPMFLVIVLARAASAAGGASPLARSLRAAVAFGGVFGAAFLLLDRMDPIYLSGFGL